MRWIRFTLLSAFVAGQFSSAQGTQGGAPGSTAPIELAGSWRGVYAADRTVILADLDLSPSPDKQGVTGELRMKTVTLAGARGPAAKPVEASWKLSGAFDPRTRTVILTPLPGAQSGPAPGLQPRRLDAVVSVGRAELGGQLQLPAGSSPDAPYFVFARANADAKIRALADHAASLPPAFRAAGSAPADEAIVKWASRLVDEYGKTVLAAAVEKLSAQAMPLLGDAAFKPVFGETYDAIDFGKLASAMQRVGAAVAGGGGRPNPQFARENGYVQYILWPSATKLVWAAALRTIDAWENECLAPFRADAAVAGSLAELDPVQKSIVERTAFTFPSEKKKKAAAFEEIRSRLGSVAVGPSVDRAIAGAVGLAGARTLASWAADNSLLLSRCAAADREAALKRIDAKLDALLDEQLAEPLGRLEKIANGPDAVREGAAWYATLVTRFGFAAQRPPVQKAVAKLTARREQDITAGREKILERIEAAKTTGEIDVQLATELSIPGDSQKSVYASIVEGVKKRKAELQKEKLLTLFSAQEKEWMDAPGHVDVKRGAGMAPSEDSIRYALLRGFAYGTGTMIDEHSARHVTRARSLGLPYPIVVTLGDVHLESFVPSDDAKSFQCVYTLSMKFTIPPDNVLASYDAAVRRGIDAQTEVLNTLLRATEKSSSTMVFRLYEDGWGAPKLRENGAAEAAIDLLIKRA